MTITCKSYRATIKDGHVELDIDPIQDDKLFIPDVAARLKRTSKTVQRLSRRTRNPLPLVRGKGRPFIFESALDAYVRGSSVLRYL